MYGVEVWGLEQYLFKSQVFAEGRGCVVNRGISRLHVARAAGRVTYIPEAERQSRKLTVRFLQHFEIAVNKNECHSLQLSCCTCKDVIKKKMFASTVLIQK